MCAKNFPQRDTDPDVATFQIVLDMLKQIKDDLARVRDELGGVKEELGEVKRRQDNVEKELRAACIQLHAVSADMRTFHVTQKSFVGRLHYVEEACIDRPLRSTPPAPISAAQVEGGLGEVDGRRKG